MKNGREPPASDPATKNREMENIMTVKHESHLRQQALRTFFTSGMRRTIWTGKIESIWIRRCSSANQ